MSCVCAECGHRMDIVPAVAICSSCGSRQLRRELPKQLRRIAVIHDLTRVADVIGWELRREGINYSTVIKAAIKRGLIQAGRVNSEVTE